MDWWVLCVCLAHYFFCIGGTWPKRFQQVPSCLVLPPAASASSNIRTAPHSVKLPLWVRLLAACSFWERLVCASLLRVCAGSWYRVPSSTSVPFTRFSCAMKLTQLSSNAIRDCKSTDPLEPTCDSASKPKISLLLRHRSTGVFVT